MPLNIVFSRPQNCSRLNTLLLKHYYRHQGKHSKNRQNRKNPRLEPPKPCQGLGPRAPKKLLIARKDPLTKTPFGRLPIGSLQQQEVLTKDDAVFWSAINEIAETLYQRDAETRLVEKERSLVNSQKNPRAHKNKIGTPPQKNLKYPPLKGGILWT